MVFVVVFNVYFRVSGESTVVSVVCLVKVREGRRRRCESTVSPLPIFEQGTRTLVLTHSLLSMSRSLSCLEGTSSRPQGLSSDSVSTTRLCFPHSLESESLGTERLRL